MIIKKIFLMALVYSICHPYAIEPMQDTNSKKNPVFVNANGSRALCKIDGGIELYDTNTNTKIHSYEFPRHLTGVPVFSPDGTLFTIEQQETHQPTKLCLELCSAHDGKTIKKIATEPGMLYYRISKDNNYLGILRPNRGIAIIDIKENIWHRLIAVDHKLPQLMPDFLEFAPDCSRVFFATIHDKHPYWRTAIPQYTSTLRSWQFQKLGNEQISILETSAYYLPQNQRLLLDSACNNVIIPEDDMSCAVMKLPDQHKLPFKAPNINWQSCSFNSNATLLAYSLKKKKNKHTTHVVVKTDNPSRTIWRQKAHPKHSKCILITDAEKRTYALYQKTATLLCIQRVLSGMLAAEIQTEEPIGDFDCSQDGNCIVVHNNKKPAVYKNLIINIEKKLSGQTGLNNLAHKKQLCDVIIITPNSNE